jgi:hypothetical protein
VTQSSASTTACGSSGTCLFQTPAPHPARRVPFRSLRRPRNAPRNTSARSPSPVSANAVGPPSPPRPLPSSVVASLSPFSSAPAFLARPSPARSCVSLRPSRPVRPLRLAPACSLSAFAPCPWLVLRLSPSLPTFPGRERGAHAPKRPKTAAQGPANREEGATAGKGGRGALFACDSPFFSPISEQVFWAIRRIFLDTWPGRRRPHQHDVAPRGRGIARPY